MRTKIVIVHGTFARNAAWTQPNSKLCQKLVDSLGPHISIDNFVWSGWNSAAARSKAALALRNKLEAIQLRERPDHLAVIGHSHGGTVAMKAIDCDALRNVISVVCLSTPFLRAFPRRLPSFVTTHILFTLSLALAVLAGPGSLGMIMRSSMLVYAPTYWDQALWDPFVKLIDPIIAIALYLLFEILRSYLARKARQSADILNHDSKIPSDNVLLIRVTGDEASSWIGIFQVLSWLSSRAAASYVSILLRTTRAIRLIRLGILRHILRRAKLYLLFLAIFSIFFIVDAAYFNSHLLQQIPDLVWMPILLAPALAFGFLRSLKWLNIRTKTAGILLIPVVPILASVTVILTLFGSVTFGVGTGLLSLFYELSVESSPVGNFQITVVSPMSSDALRHGQSYQSPAAQSLIVSWLAQRYRIIST